MVTAVTNAGAAVRDPLAAFRREDAASVESSKTDEMSDRFLKLLVAQMQNQDPMNPLDNAQVTTQMAQINTVNGIEKLNRTMTGMAGQFAQLQMLQGAALVGRDAVVPGNALAIRDGVGAEVLSPSGEVIETVELGSRAAGEHRFEWTPPASLSDAAREDLRFRVVATRGTADTQVPTLMRDRVDAIRTTGDGLTLELRRSGPVPYTEVKAVS
ncbi:MAG: flagellar hook assembly protein FlgD [Ideonella sp.]|nr:flagellar hook assembly protein FlgD [Ideonella sp.]